jgi:hypothetical protein
MATYITSARWASTSSRAAGEQPAFSPVLRFAIQHPRAKAGALAYELPSCRRLPLAGGSVAELRQEAVASGLVAKISGTTPWRWLDHDASRGAIAAGYSRAIRSSAAKLAASSISNQRRRKSATLGPCDYVLCVDDKTSIQSRRRKHRSLAPSPGAPDLCVEHEYARAGALA